MIFVTVGTNEARFDRLIEAIAALDVDEQIVVQRGSSAVYPENAEVHDFLPFEMLVELVRSSRAVVSHAGVGSIMVALANERKPIVVPRLKAFGEAVDDHQVLFARRFEAEGLVSLANPETLRLVLARSESSLAMTTAEEAPLVEDLRNFIVDSIGVEPTKRRAIPADAREG